LIVEKNHQAVVERKAGAILEYLDFRPVESLAVGGVLRAVRMVDKTVLAKKVSAIRDAVRRIREVLPDSADAFRTDRTAREVVMLNLLVGLQESISLATHWLTDEGWGVPQSYGEVFLILAERGVLERDLATRLHAAAGLRNLIAHQYAAIDSDRIFGIATNQLDDLLSCWLRIAQRAAST
jgi:uncharacterized protein YutE (UPF0331/DUF86 family)